MYEVLRGQGGEDRSAVDHRLPLDQTPANCSWTWRGRRPPPSTGGAEYLMMIVDDYSRLAWTYFLKKKFDLPAVFGGFLTDIRAQSNPCAVESLRSDNGTEPTKKKLVTLLDHHHMPRTTSRVFPGAQRWLPAMQSDDAGAWDRFLPGGPSPVQ